MNIRIVACVFGLFIFSVACVPKNDVSADEPDAVNSNGQMDPHNVSEDKGDKDLTEAESIIEYGSFTDKRDGLTYSTVEIGSQTWMAENLNYATKEGSMCYQVDPQHCERYGRLYQWEAALDACPPGWRLPTRDEYRILLDHIGSRPPVAYHQLREGGGSGFNARLGGWYEAEGSFHNLGINGNWWTATEANPETAFNLNMLQYSYAAVSGSDFKNRGQSVRCIRE